MAKTKGVKSFLENGGTYEDFKGFSPEKKAYESLLVHRHEEEWICFVRKGAKMADKVNGVDVVVETMDFGRLIVKVKTSKKEKEKVCEIVHRPLAAVIVIERDDDIDCVWKKMRQALFELRAQIMNIRNGH